MNSGALVGAMLMSSPVAAVKVAAESKAPYISEVFVAYGKTEDKNQLFYPEARRIIMLRYQGLTDGEIERVIGIGRHTFQNRLKRALQKLGFNAEDFH